MNDEVIRLSMLLMLRGHQQDVALTLRDARLLGHMEEWLVWASRQANASHGVKALRLQDLRARAGRSVLPVEERTEFVDLHAWEDELFKDVDKGKKLLRDAIVQTLSTLKSTQDLDVEQMYERLTEPSGEHPVGRLYHLSKFSTRTDRLSGLAACLHELSDAGLIIQVAAPLGKWLRYRVLPLPR